MPNPNLRVLVHKYKTFRIKLCAEVLIASFSQFFFPRQSPSSFSNHCRSLKNPPLNLHIVSNYFVAMAVENDVWQGFVSSILSESKEGNLTKDVLSPEDTAWVDSCLVNDPELTDDSWNALKDALLDIVSPQPTSEASASGIEGLPREAFDGDVPMSEEAETADVPVGADDIFLSTIEKAETSQNLGGTDDNLVPSSARLQNYFRSGVLYEFRHLEENEDNEVKVDLGSMNEMEASSENIFRVWDFDTPTEEFELDQQLRKAFTDSSLEAAAPTLDNSPNDLDKESLNILIAGLADLSLLPSPIWN